MKNTAKKLLSIALALTMIVPMFAMPSEAADTAPELITSTSGYSNIEVRVTTDKDPVSYSIGDPVTFTMKVYADNKHVSVPMIKCKLEGDGSDALGVDKFSKEYTLTPDANGVFTLTETVISIPGYMRLEGDIYSADGTTKWAETPNNDRAKALGAGILVNYEDITTVMPEPDDFDTVWAKRLAELEAVEPKIARIDKVTKWYNGSTQKTANSSYDVYAIYIDCIGNAGDIIKGDDLGNEVGATWAVAYLTVPKNKTDGSMSISQGYQGYGINTATPTESYSNIAVNMSTHALVLLNNDNAATSSTYKSTYTSYIKGGSNYGYDATDNSAIETCYFANMLLRDLQVLRFVKQAFGTEGGAALVDENTDIRNMTSSELTTAMEYWKGLYNGKIIVQGGSQGGFQAIGVAAFEEDVVSVNANIPWMGDTHIDTDSQRLHGGSNRPTPGDGIRYCDTAFLVRRVEAPITINARLVDKSCVPSGTISIWNNLVDSKKNVEGYMGSINFAQSGTHSYTPTYPENQVQTLRTYELNEPTGVPNSEDGFATSGFTDIDGVVVNQDAPPSDTGYVQIGTSTKSSATVASGTTPKFYYMPGADVYYNADLKKLVFVSKSSAKIAPNWEHHVIKDGQNSNVDGNVWYLAYWASQNKLNVKDVEFRCTSSGTNSFNLLGYLTAQLAGVETVKFDAKLTGGSWSPSKSSEGFIVGMASLKTAGHGTFDADGNFIATTYNNGVVDLTGFTNCGTNVWKYMLYNCSSVTEVVIPTLTGANMFEGCSSLETVTIPASATLTSIGANGFKNCNRLGEINIECNLSSLSIGSAAFSGKAITINVKTDADKTIVTNALSAASITNVTVLSAGEEPPIVEEPEEPEFTEGIAYGEDGYTNSKYSDIDSADSGFVQIGTSSTTKAKVTETFKPKLYYLKNTNAYYNAMQKKLVFVMASSGGITGASGENKETTTKNQDTVGATWYLAYWIMQNTSDIKEVEFRGGAGGTKLRWIGYFTAPLENVVSVKIASEINALDSNKSGYADSVFNGMSALKSAGHGTFASNGDFTPTTYTEGIVDISGFSAAAAGTLKYCLYNKPYITTAKTHTLADINMFDGCSALTTVVVPTGATLTSIGTSVFNDCSALETIQILGTVDSTLAINASAFTGTGDVNVIVNTLAEKGYFETALNEASITNVTVTSVEVDEPDEPDEPDDSDVPSVPDGPIAPIDVPNAITADGFQVRMEEYTGLRALFTFKQSIANQNKGNGYTLVSYGAIASSYKKLIEDFGGDEDALFAAAREVTDNTQSAIKYIPVYNADGTGANRYVDIDKKQFCISLTSIAPENALSDIYLAGYVIWADSEGNLGYTLTTYDMADGEKAVNLYEITLGLTKNGLINSENTEDVCFWQILKNGALKTDSFNTANDSYVTKGYTLDNGYFTYCDIDWYAYEGNSTTSWWSSTKPTGVADSASGLVWSVLKYSDSEYVMIYRNKNKSTYQDLQIPMHSVTALAYAPYDYRYGANVGTTLKTYNPALTQTDFNKILTVVIDHGVAGMNHGGLSAIDKVTTIVYPSSFSAKNQAFINTKNLKNVIWCHTDSNGNPVAHMSEFSGITSLVDLRGFTAIGFTETFNADWPIENVVFGSTTSGGTSKTFNGLTQLKRVWSADQSMPASGVLDLSELNITSIGQQTFNNVGMATTVKLPDTITKISGTQALGNKKTIDFICSDTVAEIVAVFARDTDSTNTVNISVNGTPIADLVS